MKLFIDTLLNNYKNMKKWPPVYLMYLHLSANWRSISCCDELTRVCICTCLRHCWYSPSQMPQQLFAAGTFGKRPPLIIIKQCNRYAVLLTVTVRLTEHKPS